MLLFYSIDIIVDKPETSIRVRYSETDQMGVAYHGSLIPWFEVGRTDLLRFTGMSYCDIEKKYGIHLAVVGASLTYSKRIHYDDTLVIDTTLTEMGKSRLTFSYRVLRENVLVATGHSTHVCVDESGKPQRWPREINQQFTQMLQLNGK